MTGYPTQEAAQLGRELGYEDRLLNAGEIFHSWVIEAPPWVAEELPLSKAGLHVTWTQDYKPYRDRKVRILNGGHTMMVLGAFLAGKNTVTECMADPVISAYLARGLAEEIIPTLDLPRIELERFADAVGERFANPHVKHELLSISLNSTSKFATRILPSLKIYQAQRGTLPNRLTFSLAALIAFYRGTEIHDGALIGTRSAGDEYRIQDGLTVLEFFRELWSTRALDSAALTEAVLSNVELWKDDLSLIPGLTEAVAQHVSAFVTAGAEQAFKRLENG